MSLKRSLGVLGLLSAALGGIIGSGWLFGPYFAAKVAGPGAIFSWILGGGLMIVIALTFSELGSTFPVAGGSARYLHFTHGSVVGFGMAWIIWLASVAVAPVETLALLHYASSYLPWLLHPAGGQVVLTVKGFLVAGVLLALLCFINTISVQQVSKTNIVIVILKLAVPILTAVILLNVDYHPINFKGLSFTSNIQGILSALPTAGVIFSFIGYSPAIQLAGEAKNPQRAIPIAVIGALVICIVLYTVLQIAFIGALSPADYQHGWAHLSFQGDIGPFAGIAMGLGLFWLAKILYADAVLSPFGTALIYTTAASRLAYAMVHNQYLPNVLSVLNRYRIPTRILLMNYVIGMLLFLPFPTWQNMVAFLVSALVFAYAIGPLSLLVLRKTLPDHPRVFKLPFATTICLLAFYICNLILYWSGWSVIYKMLIAVVIGYIFYIVKEMRAAKRFDNKNWVKSVWFFIYMALIGTCSYFGSFGGTGVIKFGWDFVVIAVLTLLIFIWSMKQKMSAHAVEAEWKQHDKIY